MSENTDPLLPSEAQEASAIIPGIGISTLGLGNYSESLQIGKFVKGD